MMKMLTLSVVSILLIILIPRPSAGQSNPQFDITMRIDYASAEQMIDFFDRRTYNTDVVADAKGNKIAAATSLILARTNRPPEDFSHQLGLVRDDYNVSEDVYGLKETRLHVDQLRKLLMELRKRQLERRVIATVESFLPSDIKVSGTIPVFVVAMGNEKAAAFVRRIVWKDENPVFVGENQGEEVIVLNLARMLTYNKEINSQFIELLGTLAHECFHAVFGIYQQNSEIWRSFHQRSDPIWNLAELVQNEGIAYYLSLQLQIGGQTPSAPWFDATNRAMKNFNSASKELLAPLVQGQRAREIILNANMSGSFEGNYGATAGLRIAYEIDTRLGRPVLTETISDGVKDFFGKYDTLCSQNPGLPKVDEAVLRVLEQ